jgi:alkylation response protein AidB-like acyl-CoA dehydrogenase
MTLRQTDHSQQASKLDAAIADLTELAAVHKEEGDTLRKLPPALADAFLRHDVYRMLLPHDLGGASMDPLDYLQFVEDIARVDGSTAWTLALGIGSSIFFGYLPPERARAMVGDRACGIAGAYAPLGRGEVVEGGYRVSGHWGWASGVDQARWMVFGFTVNPPDGADRPEARQALASREAFQVLDTWQVSGMRGTGSTEYEVANLFVPAEMTFRMFVGRPRHSAPFFRMPGAFFGAAVASVALGIALGATESLTRLAVSKQASAGRSALRDQAFAHYAVAKAQVLAESASSHLRQSIADIWRTIRSDKEIALEQRMRARRASVHAAEASADAVDLCCRAAGGHALFLSQPFERALRDVRAAIANIGLQRSTMEDAGRAAFGLDPVWPIF